MRKPTIRAALALVVAHWLVVVPATGTQAAPPLLPEGTIASIAREVSGEVAKRNLELLAREHRMRGSRGFRVAAEQIAGELESYGLDVTVEQLAADGETMYGTQKARPAWDADFAELWELRATSGGWERERRIASFEAMPIGLAEDSESADVVADLVDVGNGTAEGDYAGKDVAGKLVLAAAQPGPVSHLAVARFGAAGIVSYAQNQRTAWWGENERLVRWGHLDSFAPFDTFAFMVSPGQAREYRARLARGERVRLHAVVRAGRHEGSYDIVNAVIPGADPALRDQEIVLGCHLDHQRPAANDNASGCVAILEVARSLAKLIGEGALEPPARTLRFVWPPEIEGTLALLNARPETAARIVAAVHMDMVGGGPETKAIFHITRGPMSLPSFVYDVGQAFGVFVNQQSAAFAGGADPPYPLVAVEGGKEALLAEPAEFSMGSDHEVYMEGSFRIPTIYLNDWPDRYIHTNLDSAENIDPTKLKRAAFIGAASAYFLATMSPADAAPLQRLVATASLRRTATMLERRAALPPAEAANLTRTHLWYERAVFESIGDFIPVADEVGREAERFFSGLEGLVGATGGGSGEAEAPGEPGAAGRGDAGAGGRGEAGGAGRGGIVGAGTSEAGTGAELVFSRMPRSKGTMWAFGYSFFDERHEGPTPGLLSHRGLRGTGDLYAYEVLNLVDGKRSARQIRDVVAAELGPVPLELVIEYLLALESIGVVGR